MSQDWLPRSLAWSLSSFGGSIEWSDCASRNPREWHPEDLEVFYTNGYCHHLAIALHRLHGHRIAALVETDRYNIEDPAMPIPQHVFVVPGPRNTTVRLGSGRHHGLDICGSRPLEQLAYEYPGLVRPKVITYPGERWFRELLLDRMDHPLKPVNETEIEAAQAVVLHRFPALFDEIRENREKSHAGRTNTCASSMDTGSPGP